MMSLTKSQGAALIQAEDAAVRLSVKRAKVSTAVKAWQAAATKSRNAFDQACERMIAQFAGVTLAQAAVTLAGEADRRALRSLGCIA